MADLFGDWREEAMYRRRDNKALRINVSTFPTDYRFHTFMEDPCYRNSVAAENAGYNVCPEPGFYFGPELICLLLIVLSPSIGEIESILQEFGVSAIQEICL